MVFLHLFLLPLFSLIIIALPSPEDTRPISDPSNTKHHSTSLTSIWDRIEHIWEWGEDEPKLYITTKDPDPSKRKEEVQRNRDGYDYGPPKLGETSYFPSGTLAEEMVRRQRAEWIAEQAPFAVPVEGEEISARRAVVWDGNLNNLGSYRALYEDQWSSTVPSGVSHGGLTNYTQDLYFSMARLSGNPFSMHRVNPQNSSSSLPFTIHDELCEKISGSKFSDLIQDGRMFIMDHSYFASDPEYMKHRIDGRYSAATVSLFYLTNEGQRNSTNSVPSEKTEKQLLPLAIKMGVGKDLVYTPLDHQYEWLLAKIAANSNDLFHAQIYHLISTHAVAEIVHLAAIRTVSERHPIRAYLERVMYRCYAVRPIGERILFNDGGLFDSIFSLSSRAVLHFAKVFYPSAGRFKATYYAPELASRGLVNSKSGPELPHFPFYEDMSPIVSAIREFAQHYVDAYYASDDMLRNDTEIVAWWDECNGPAEVLDFPSTDELNKSALVDVLTHMTYLAGPKHASLNMGTPFTTSGILPFFPAALYRMLPESKGVVNEHNILNWLPDAQQSVKQARLLALFNRPAELLEREGGRMMDLWVGDEGENGASRKVARAARRYREQLRELDEKINGREFGKDGLSQGMPFVYKTLRPGGFPYYLAI